jgi:hypothetical protein
MKIRRSFQKDTESPIYLFTVPNYIEDLLNEYDEMTIKLIVTNQRIDVLVNMEQ